MTRCRLIDDAQLRPDLFHWNGQMDEPSLRGWLAANQWLGPCPSDLLAFWRETGGGDLFETETMLGPLGDPQEGDDIATVNHALRSRGMPPRFAVFHLGACLSAVDTEIGDYVELEESSSFRVARRFSSLDEWYEATLLKEYRERYGL